MKKEILILVIIIGAFAVIQSLNFVSAPETSGSPLVLQTNEDNFSQNMNVAHEWVLLEFWAPWCPHCRKMKPDINQIAEDMQEQLTVLGINKDEAPGLANEFRVEGIPCLILLYKGREVDRQVGRRPKSVIAHWIKSSIETELGSGT